MWDKFTALGVKAATLQAAVLLVLPPLYPLTAWPDNMYLIFFIIDLNLRNYSV